LCGDRPALACTDDDDDDDDDDKDDCLWSDTEFDIEEPVRYVSLYFSINEEFSILSRVSILTRDIDIANLSVYLSVRLSVRYVPVSDENGLTYRHSFSPYGSPIILVLPASNIFTKFRRSHPLRKR